MNPRNQMEVLSLDDVTLSLEPNVGFVIVKITIFASVMIVGFDSHAPNVGDLAVGVIHSRFFM